MVPKCAVNKRNIKISNESNVHSEKSCFRHNNSSGFFFISNALKHLLNHLHLHEYLRYEMNDE